MVQEVFVGLDVGFEPQLGEDFVGDLLLLRVRDRLIDHLPYLPRDDRGVGVTDGDLDLPVAHRSRLRSVSWSAFRIVAETERRSSSACAFSCSAKSGGRTDWTVTPTC